jgi:pyridoxal phosphate enzyme (YggS family)
MGVSKFFPREAVDEAWRAGLTLFGESRVQEAAVKFAGFRDSMPGVELHFLGGLQRNKAKKAAAFFDAIQSVDRDELLDALAAESAGRERPLEILFEFNSGEAQKGGYRSEKELFNAVERALHVPSLQIRGIMTIAPLSADKEDTRKAFRRLARLGEKLRGAFPEADFSVLSMGMSGDFPLAIEEGSTLIRIGTAIFGERT